MTAAGTSIEAPNFTVLALLSASVPKKPTKLLAHMTCLRPGNISKLTISAPAPAAMSARLFASTPSSVARDVPRAETDLRGGDLSRPDARARPRPHMGRRRRPLPDARQDRRGLCSDDCGMASQGHAGTTVVARCELPPDGTPRELFSPAPRISPGSLQTRMLCPYTIQLDGIRME
jgi:hypothetical protein